MIVGGSVESLKLLKNQPEFQKLSQLVVVDNLEKIVGGEGDKLLLGDALGSAIFLLNLVYQGLDEQVPQRDLLDLLGVD
jgi:hypothetical protein